MTDLYLVFAGETYYATGGANDLVRVFEDDPNAAFEFCDALVEGTAEDFGWPRPRGFDYDWAHVLHASACKIIHEAGCGAHGSGSGMHKGARLVKSTEKIEGEL